MIGRRHFFIGASALLAAPAIVRAASLMPIQRPLVSMGNGSEWPCEVFIPGHRYVIPVGGTVTFRAPRGWIQMGPIKPIPAWIAAGEQAIPRSGRAE